MQHERTAYPRLARRGCGRTGHDLGLCPCGRPCETFRPLPSGSEPLKQAEYETGLAERQRKLSLLQQAYVRQARQAVVVLEGRDAAGKGGIIRRIGWGLDPRSLRVWPIGPPNPEEKREHWQQRFWRRLPRAGEFAVFDRSWYGRVLVERVEGFAEEQKWRRAYDEINAFERTLVSEGVRLVKLFLDIGFDTQLDRFRKRFENPAKRWKITEEDVRNRARWDAYSEAYDEMRAQCSPATAPWSTIEADDKRHARLTAFDVMLSTLGEGVDIGPSKASPMVMAFFRER